MKRKPNVILIYADDMGRGMLSCYGQKHFKTPNMDRIANNGIKFNRAYGCAVCAPARASLICGIHDCHAGRWTHTKAGIYLNLGIDIELNEIYDILDNTGYTQKPSEKYLAQILKDDGYVTGQVGKLEWGFATTYKDIKSHGWDYHYGYYDHKQCHGFYPPYLFEDGNIVDIEGNIYPDCGKAPAYESEENYKSRWDMTGKKVYSQDLFNEKILDFIDENQDKPFFLYHPSQLPHGPIAVPEMHKDAKDLDELTQFEKEYVSMILRLDDTIGMIYKSLEEKGLLEDTIIILSGDNGHGMYYAQEGRTIEYNKYTGERFDFCENNFTTELSNDTFNGNDGMRGRKRTSLEGGVRVPYLISWQGHSPAGVESEHMLANYDMLATFCDLTGVEVPEDKDGISFLDVIKGDKAKKEHDYVVYASHGGPGLTMNDGWKVRFMPEIQKFQLFNINEDYAETTDLAEKNPEKLRELAMLLLNECDGEFMNGTPMNHIAKIIPNYL